MISKRVRIKCERQSKRRWEGEREKRRVQNTQTKSDTQRWIMNLLQVRLNRIQSRMQSGCGRNDLQLNSIIPKNPIVSAWCQEEEIRTNIHCDATHRQRLSSYCVHASISSQHTIYEVPSIFNKKKWTNSHVLLYVSNFTEINHRGPQRCWHHVQSLCVVFGENNRESWASPRLWWRCEGLDDCGSANVPDTAARAPSVLE